MKTNKIILTVFAIGCMLVSEAQLTAPMLFGISQGVKEEKWYANPAVGPILINSGFVDSLRFWGNWDFAYNTDHPDERDYLNDRPQDAVMAILRHLFPSPTGVLGGVNSEKFFCNFANATNIAQLINALGKEGDFSQNIDNWVDGTDVDGRKLFNSGAKNKCVKEFANCLKGLASCQHYPSQIIEQLLMAFLYENCNTTEDLEAYWKNLENSLKIEGYPFNKDSLLTPELMLNIAKDPANVTLLSYILILKSVKNIHSTTLYNMNEELFSNGRAKPYNRKENKLEGPYFADCVETMIRQTINFLLWVNKEKRFHIDELIGKYMAQPHLHVGLNNFNNLKTFFTSIQTSETQANDSSPGMRGEWNKVVGDLDGNVLYSRPNHNEIEPGFINLLRVMRRILDLPITDLSELTELLEGGDQNKGTIGKKILQKLQEMFDFIKTSEKTVVLELKDLRISDKDVYGNLTVTNTLTENYSKFSFNIMVSGGHGEVNQLKQEKEGFQVDFLEKLKSHLSLPQGNLREIACLAAKEFEVQQDSPHQTIYGLYGSRIRGNKSMSQFLERISTLPDNILGRDNVIVELMKSIRWEDEQIYLEYKGLYHGLLKKYPDLMKNLEFLNYSGIQCPNEILNLTSAVRIKNICLKDSVIGGIKGLEGKKTLEKLDCSYLKMPNATLDLSGSTALKELNLHNPCLGGIRGLSTNSLEKLICDGLKVSDVELILTSLPGLKTFDICGAYTGGTKEPEKNNVLKTLSFNRVHMPNTILDVSDLTELRRLTLRGTHLGGIRGLENKKTLEFLNCSSLEVPNTVLDLSGLTELTILFLNNAKLGGIRGLSIPSLERLDCSRLKMPNASLNISGLTGLKELNLTAATLGGLEGLSSPSLEELDCTDLDMPNASLDVSGLAGLKRLGKNGALFGKLKGVNESKVKFLKKPSTRPRHKFFSDD